MENIRNAFDRTREPFSIRVFRERIYVISSPWDTTTAYKNSTSFSWDEYLNLLLRAFGITGEALERSWHDPRPNDREYGRNPLNPQNKNLVHLIEDFYKLQLLPGEHLARLTDAYLDCLDRVIQWSGIPSQCVLNEGFAYKRVSLKLFVRTTMTEAITRAMLGDVIFDIEPEVVHQLMVLNDYSWAIIFNYPKFLTPKLKPAVERLSRATRTYLRSPDSEKADACWAIRSVLKSQEISGLDEDSRVAMVIMIWWAAHSNTVNAGFWLLSYLLFNPALLAAVKEETGHAFTNGRLDTAKLANDCPILDSVWLEVLRLVNGAMSVRKVVTPTTISGKELESGNTVIIPFRQLHFNEHVWGQARFGFDPERFLKGQKLRNHASYRPFGGGVSLCPGRHLAKSEVCGFLATLLQRYDVALPAALPPQVFPRLDETKPSTGITGALGDMDVVFDIVSAIR
ncbi:hypothetical protein SLS54_005169 [Diplodia seriata]